MAQTHERPENWEGSVRGRIDRRGSDINIEIDNQTSRQNGTGRHQKTCGRLGRFSGPFPAGLMAANAPLPEHRDEPGEVIVFDRRVRRCFFFFLFYDGIKVFRRSLWGANLDDRHAHRKICPSNRKPHRAAPPSLSLLSSSVSTAAAAVVVVVGRCVLSGAGRSCRPRFPLTFGH